MKNLIKASAALMSLSLFGCFNSQPTPPCAVGHGGYSALLIKTSGPATGSCVRNADIIGVQKYRQADGTQDIFLKPESISAFQYLDGVPLGGDYTSLASATLASNVPDADGFCTLPSLTAATGDTLLGEDLTYTFTNVQFFVRGSTAGTQFSADLTISDTSDPASCTATYDVRAMYPVIFCNDLEGDITAPREESCGEVDHVWSGVAVNPLFNTTCEAYGNLAHDPAGYDYVLDPASEFLGGDPDALGSGVPWHICVPNGEIPALVAGAE